MSPASITPAQFTTFGELLKYLRHKARITQRELALAVGYSDTQISRLEQNQRVPDATTIQALFVPALYIEQEPKWVERLLELAKSVPGDDEPPLSSKNKPTAPHNLPNPLTSFIGREREIKEIGGLIKTQRLITLTGSGGVGKTRLSLQVASELLISFPDGVWRVEFAPINDPALVPFTLANVFGLRESGESKSSLTELLVDYFRTRKALLLFDNCEHLIESIARLADVLLQACHDLSILASSREALGVAGEVAYRVPSLGLPDPKLFSSAEALSQYESVRLFVERCTTAVPTFTLTSDNAPILAQICQRLDGIPLAIELAATKIRVLSLEQIAQRLDDRFRLLTGGSRTALERHQTLRATIDWSYRLLTEPEQSLLQRLAAFVGGWTLAAAESVCGFGRIESSEVLDLLTHLVDKSLVAVDVQAEESRYHMLETIRQYAREKLLDSGESELVRKGHGNWFLQLAESAESGLLAGHEEVRWLNQLENDLDNFRAALSYLSEASEVEKCASLSSTLGLFWLNRNYLAEGRYWLEKGLEHREVLSKITIAHSLGILGRLLAWMGEYEGGIRCGEESVALFRELGDKFELAFAIELLGETTTENGDDVGYTYFEEALQLYREMENHEYANVVLIELGWRKVAKGNFLEGFAILEECLRTAQEFHVPVTVAYSLFVLGICRWHHDELDRSEAALKESMRLFSQLGHKWFMMACLAGLAGVVCARGQFKRAAIFLGISDKGIESVGGMKPPFWVVEVYGPIIDSIRSQIGDSACTTAWNEGHSMILEHAIEFALEVANE